MDLVGLGMVQVVDKLRNRLELYMDRRMSMRGKWIVDIDNMVCISDDEIGKRYGWFKIMYVEEEDAVYSYWEVGKHNGWSKCVSEIRAAYLRAREIEAERVLLEEIECNT